MNSRLSIRSAAATTPSAVDTSKAQRDEVSKIQQDINVLNQKIAELRGEPTPAVDPDSASVNSASPFVVGLRSLAEQERKFKDVKDLRINAMEKLMERVAEYDRLLLKETTPVVDPTAIPQRRKSFGQDLYCLPTHLHLTARLMDLHAASKRVTVIKTVDGAGISTASCAVPPNPADKKIIDGLKTTVAKQAKQIEDAEGKRLNSEEAIQQLKRSNDELKAHIQTLQSKPPVASVEETQKDAEAKRLRSEQEMQQLKRCNEELMTQLQDLRNRPPVVAVEETPTISAPPVIDYSVEVRQLRERVLELERHTDTLQQRLEVEVGNYQGMVAVALGKASRLNNHTELSGKGDDCVNLPSDARNAYNLLEKAIAGRLDGLRAELSLMTSVKDLLDGELSTANLQKDILQRDLVTVQEQHEALKAAYDALSYETARQVSHTQSHNAELEAQSQQLQTANDTNKVLLEELKFAQDNLKSLDKWPAALAALEEKLAAAVQDKTRAETTAVSAREEVGHYKKLTETLKQKLRELGGGTADSKEFLDSFEEVMKEEMMTMKAAFETKLRMAREEADATSKRHQQEITRMHNTSPYAALNRLAANGTPVPPAGTGGVGIAGLTSGAKGPSKFLR